MERTERSKGGEVRGNGRTRDVPTRGSTGPETSRPDVPGSRLVDADAVFEVFDPVPMTFATEGRPPEVIIDVTDAHDDGVRIGDRSSTAETAGTNGASGGAPDVQSGAGDEAGPDAGYQRRLGERLRVVRRAHGMRLQDVEERSGGRFKAVVIGSYERGDRAIATHKLAALAAFYGVPIGELLPDDGWPAPAPTSTPGIRLVVPAVLAAADDADAVALRRVVQHVRVLRGDHHGQVLTLRGDDLRTVAVTLGVEVADLPSWLASRGFLAH